MFDFNNSFISANSIVAVLEVKAEGTIDIVFKEHIADKTVENVID